jgi:choline dehydrogenase-like flavoprotein
MTSKRSSAAKVYLDSVRKNKNIDVVNYAFFKKIIIENNTATGVEFDRFGQTYKVIGKRDIILSAGAINSPQILMLSGIGPKNYLKSLKIPVIKDLPVGHNLQDHYGSSLSFTVNKNIAINFKRDMNFMEILKYFLYSEGLLSQSQIDSIAFINTNNNSINVPNVRLLLQSFSFASDNGVMIKKLFAINDNLWKYFKHHTNDETFTIASHLLHPKSRGTIELRSSDPYDYPIINPKYFSDPEDMKTIVEALKITQRMIETEPFRALNAKLFKKPEECDKPSFKSDKYNECIARTITLTSYSPVGTCRMGSSSSPTSVVDPELRVIGIQNLRVADASVMPSII